MICDFCSCFPCFPPSTIYSLTAVILSPFFPHHVAHFIILSLCFSLWLTWLLIICVIISSLPLPLHPAPALMLSYTFLANPSWMFCPLPDCWCRLARTLRARSEDDEEYEDDEVERSDGEIIQPGRSLGCLHKTWGWRGRAADSAHSITLQQRGAAFNQ